MCYCGKVHEVKGGGADGHIVQGKQYPQRDKKFAGNERDQSGQKEIFPHEGAAYDKHPGRNSPEYDVRYYHQQLGSP
jgi:hypothetical protein